MAGFPGRVEPHETRQRVYLCMAQLSDQEKCIPGMRNQGKSSPP